LKNVIYWQLLAEDSLKSPLQHAWASLVTPVLCPLLKKLPVAAVNLALCVRMQLQR
jgi:hypothetical protein